MGAWNWEVLMISMQKHTRKINVCWSPLLLWPFSLRFAQPLDMTLSQSRRNHCDVRNSWIPKLWKGNKTGLILIVVLLASEYISRKGSSFLMMQAFVDTRGSSQTLRLAGQGRYRHLCKTANWTLLGVLKFHSGRPNLPTSLWLPSLLPSFWEYIVLTWAATKMGLISD